MKPQITAVSESSCMIWLGDQIDPALSAQVATTTEAIRQKLGTALIDIVPSYSSILVTLDICQLSVQAGCEQLSALLQREPDRGSPATSQLIEIPTYYGPEVALDMEAVGAHCGLSNEDIVALHSQQRYRVYAIGFAPGFCFLGRLDERLRMPRKSTPRAQVPAGSVAIAERQTAIYPNTTPGGWQLIGRTCCDMLALCSASQRPLQVGDELRFVAISRNEFLSQGGQVQ